MHDYQGIHRHSSLLFNLSLCWSQKGTQWSEKELLSRAWNVGCIMSFDENHHSVAWIHSSPWKANLCWLDDSFDMQTARQDPHRAGCHNLRVPYQNGIWNLTRVQKHIRQLFDGISYQGDHQGDLWGRGESFGLMVYGICQEDPILQAQASDNSNVTGLHWLSYLIIESITAFIRQTV